MIAKYYKRYYNRVERAKGVIVIDLNMMEPEELKEAMEDAGVDTILYDFEQFVLKFALDIYTLNTKKAD